jgi:hypothetical protein
MQSHVGVGSCGQRCDGGGELAYRDHQTPNWQTTCSPRKWQKKGGNMKKIIGTFICSLFLLCSSAMADPRNKKTMLTFREAVELPGVVLPPGTYVFKVADFNYRDVVQVYNADESKILATVIGISAERQQTTDRTALRFGESRNASGDRLQTWFYPQEKTGREFPYTKKHPLHLAAR